MSRPLPLVYACSGCSNAAQLANHLALRLTREGLAEMSCTAGIGGGVEAILRIARQARPRITLDGCVLRCARACLEREGLASDIGINLADFGVRKRKHAEFSAADAEAVWCRLLPLLGLDAAQSLDRHRSGA
jgi:uncharacterized metal-binding protein